MLALVGDLHLEPDQMRLFAKAQVWSCMKLRHHCGCSVTLASCRARSTRPCQMPQASRGLVQPLYSWVTLAATRMPRVSDRCGCMVMHAPRRLHDTDMQRHESWPLLAGSRACFENAAAYLQGFAVPPALITGNHVRPSGCMYRRVSWQPVS